MPFPHSPLTYPMVARAHLTWFSIWTFALGALLVTLPWCCVLGILSETRMSVHWVLQGPQAAWRCGRHNTVSNHLPRALVQDGPFHMVPSSAQCPRGPSGHQTCCHPGVQDSCQLPPYKAWRTEKCVALLSDQPAHGWQKESTSPQNTTVPQGNCWPGV